MAHEWILYIDSDAAVSNRTNRLLCRYDLFQLREPDGWMTDSLIHYGVAEYSGQRGELHNHVVWVPPSVVKTGKDGDDEAFDNSLGNALGAALHLDDVRNDFPQGANVLLFPVNTEDTHWSLLAFYKATRSFVHYDSLGRSNDPAATALIRKLQARGYLSAQLAFTRPAEVVPQADGYNCGLYVVQYARAIMEHGRALAGGEIGAIDSNTADTLRGLMLTALEPLFPPAPLAAPPVALGGASSAKRVERKRPPPKLKGDSDVILKKSMWSSKGKRKDKLKAAVLLATNNDRPFTKCFIHTSPNAQAVIKGERQESLLTLVDEATTLWEVLGDSTSVPAPRRTKTGEFVSKYSTYADKKGFTLQPQVLPVFDQVTDTDRRQNVVNLVTPEGFQPTFFQFQRQEMNTLLDHYERSVPDLNHNHQHIARSLILGMAMANFYIRHGQPRFLPGDTRPEEQRKKRPDDDGQREAALANMPEPAEDEIDVAAIAFGIAMHDCARAGQGKDIWEHESARNCFYYLRELGYGNTYAAYVARMIVKNEENEEERKPKGPPKDSEEPPKKLVTVSKVDSRSKGESPRNTTRTDEPSPPRQPGLNEQIVHDADTLEIHRVLNGKKFQKERLQFLSDARLDKIVPPKGAAHYRDQLIAEAALFVELTKEIAVKPEDGEDGKPGGPGRFHFEDRLKDVKAKGGKFSGYFEDHESVLIEAIMQKPKSFPFFYEFYFHRCFDPADEQLQQLEPEERLALVRARINTIERLPRDHALATASLKDFNGSKEKAYDVNTFAQDLVKLQLTANLTCDSLALVIDAVDRVTKKPPHLTQFWEIFFKSGKTRVGASTDSVARDNAERFKVQYQTPCESDRFQRPRRPKYAAINLAKSSAGACPKYGDAVYILKPHLWRRITLTHNDTFSVAVLPDDLCTPTHPFTLLKQITGLRFQEDHLRLYAAGRGEDDKMRMAAQKKAAIPYVEAHVHGLVRWEHDVEEIRINVVPDPLKQEKVYSKPGWDWAEFDRKVQDFAALWATDERPEGIPVRFVNDQGYEVFATRADAVNNMNPIVSKAVTGKLDTPVKLKPPPKPETLAKK